MVEKHWFLQVGPCTSDEADGLAHELRQRHQETLDVEFIDERVWFSGAWDVASIRDALLVLRAGLLTESVPLDVRQSAMGLVSDMETWLSRDYDGLQEG